MRKPQGLPTGSRLGLAAICAASQVLEVVDTEFATGEAGREKHTGLGSVIEGKPLPDALTTDTKKWVENITEDEALIAPLRGSITEPAFAYDVATGLVRYVGRDVKWRYNASPTEFAGALDFVKVELVNDTVMVADLKTGQGETDHPIRNWQLRFGALTAARHFGVDNAKLGLLLAPEGRTPRWQWSHLDAFGLEEVALDLNRLAERIGWARRDVAQGKTPRLVVGEHCGNCKARHGCPARVAMAKRLGGEPEEVVMDLKMMLTPQSAAIALARWKAASKALVEVGAALYAYAKEQPIPLGGGLVWGPQQKEREVIDAEKAWFILEEEFGGKVAKAAMTLETSKAGVDRAMHEMREQLRGWPVEKPRPPGVPAGKVTLKALNEKTLETLRKKGAVTTKTITEYDEHPVAALKLAP